MKHETVAYHCDKCGRHLPTSSNALDIVTEVKGNYVWERLHVTVNHRSGVHNDGTTRSADLCKECAIELLTDALTRIAAGERATAGTEAIGMGMWGNEP